jgi:hypothetical protein
MITLPFITSVAVVVVLVADVEGYQLISRAGTENAKKWLTCTRHLYYFDTKLPLNQNCA